MLVFSLFIKYLPQSPQPFKDNQELSCCKDSVPLDAACLVLLNYMGRVLLSNSHLNPHSLLVIHLLPQLFHEAERPGRLCQWRPSKGGTEHLRLYLALMSLNSLPHSAMGPHFPCSAFHYQSSSRSPSCCLCKSQLKLSSGFPNITQIHPSNVSKFLLCSLSVLPPTIYCFFTLDLRCELPA